MWRSVDDSVGPSRKAVPMPNGGYPMQLLLPVLETGVAIHIRAGEVSVWQRAASDDDRHWEPLGTLTSEQVGALIYHLAYWNPGTNADVLAALRSSRSRVRPAFTSHDCLYEY